MGTKAADKIQDRKRGRSMETKLFAGGVVGIFKKPLGGTRGLNKRQFAGALGRSSASARAPRPPR